MGRLETQWLAGPENLSAFADLSGQVDRSCARSKAAPGHRASDFAAWHLRDGHANEMQVEIGQRPFVDGLEEAEELAMPVARHAFADDGAVEHVESREQGRGAVALVVMLFVPERPFFIAPAGSIKGLDLALFIDRQHQGLVGRIEVEADNLLDLGDEVGSRERALVGRGGDESGQERAYRAPLAATLGAKGVDGLLKDATRLARAQAELTARKIKQVVNLTLNEKPPDATHWSERTMAARAGIAPSSVHKIWAVHGLKQPSRKNPPAWRGHRSAVPVAHRQCRAPECLVRARRGVARQAPASRVHAVRREIIDPGAPPS